MGRGRTVWSSMSLTSEPHPQGSCYTAATPRHSSSNAALTSERPAAASNPDRRQHLGLDPVAWTACCGCFPRSAAV